MHITCANPDITLIHFKAHPTTIATLTAIVYTYKGTVLHATAAYRPRSMVKSTLQRAPPFLTGTSTSA